MFKQNRKTAAMLFVLLVAVSLFAPTAGAALDYNSPSYCNLVVFVRFSDDTVDAFNAVNNWSQIDKMYNGNGEGSTPDTSVKKFIYEISDRNCVVNNYFPQESPDGASVAPFTLSNNRSYYENNETAAIGEIISAIGNGTIPFNTSVKLDYKVSGVIDNLTIIVQGGAGTGSADNVTFFYPHHTSYGGDARINGCLVRDYNTVNSEELVAASGEHTYGMKQGVLSHELLHSLGMPDLYHYSGDGEPVGRWDIMAATSLYLQYPLAYMRYLVGWIDLPEITEDGHYTLDAATSLTGNRGFIVRTPLMSDQFFVLEYRMKDNSPIGQQGFEAKLPSSGMLISRVDESVVSNSNASGEDYIYVLRPETTDGSDKQTSAESAAIDIARGETSYGSTDLSAESTADTIYYSDGSNSGIYISNMTLSADGEQLSFDIDFPDYTALNLWDDFSSGALGGGYNAALAVDPAGPTVYATCETGEVTTTVTVKSSTGEGWTQVGTSFAGADNPSLYFADGTLYFACTNAAGVAECYKYVGGAWQRSLTGSGGYANNIQLFGDGTTVYCAYVANNTNLVIYNAQTGALITDSLGASYMTNPSVCKLGNSFYALYSDYFASSTAAKCGKVSGFDGSTWTTVYSSSLSASKVHSLIEKDGNIYGVLAGDSGTPLLLEYDGTSWTSENAAVFSGAGSICLMHDGTDLYAACLTVGDGKTKVYKYAASGFTSFGYDVAANTENLSAHLSDGTIYVSGSLASNQKLFVKFKAASEMPTYTLRLTPPEGYEDTTVYIDGYAFASVAEGEERAVTVEGGSCKTAVMYKYNENGVPVGMYVWTLDFDNGAYTATAVPEFENLLTYHGFSIRITGSPGIRFKTGISTSARASLTSNEKLAGYGLVEYGTLVMLGSGLADNAFIKGGSGVASGRAYWTASGAVKDYVFETVNGRYRFTSVLIDRTVSQYKTSYAFRGYIILSNGLEQVTLYGPIQSRSIYDVANQIVASGAYPEGSAVLNFVNQLIADADNYLS